MLVSYLLYKFKARFDSILNLKLMIDDLAIALLVTGCNDVLYLFYELTVDQSNQKKCNQNSNFLRLPLLSLLHYYLVCFVSKSAVGLTPTASQWSCQRDSFLIKLQIEDALLLFSLSFLFNQFSTSTHAFSLNNSQITVNSKKSSQTDSLTFN